MSARISEDRNEYPVFGAMNIEKGQTSGKLIDACLYILQKPKGHGLESWEKHLCNHGTVFGRSFWRLQSTIDSLYRKLAFAPGPPEHIH